MRFQLTYGGIPFVSDQGVTFRYALGNEAGTQKGDVVDQIIRNNSPHHDLIEELNNRIPLLYLQDFSPPGAYPGKNLGAIARTSEPGQFPNTKVRIGDFYYPNNMRRWSVFRGLATTSQVRQMMALSQINYTSSSGTQYQSGVFNLSSGDPYLTIEDNAICYITTNSGLVQSQYFPANRPYTFPTTGRSQRALDFTIAALPDGAVDPNVLYSVTTSMFMLPPRPLGEVDRSIDGLYLVTLVDERYFAQSTPASLTVKQGMTWEFLLNDLAIALGITLYTATDIESVYTAPELDSQLWANAESAATLLDAVAYNVGRVVVRNYNGSYTLYKPSESNLIATLNRSHTKTAGGELFFSGGSLFSDDSRLGRNVVIPSRVITTFPKYIVGNDPVPHFVDQRYQHPRRSTWFEDSYGGVYRCSVPITSGGVYVSGQAGVSEVYLHDTAKALISGEVAINSGVPLNNSGLVALSMQLAKDYYANQSLLSLDEVYPGIQYWTPEGLHDILYTYSAKAGGAFTRVMRKPWTDIVEEYQHATPNISGFTSSPAGIGGHSVAQTIRDQFAVSGSFIGNSGTQQTISGFPLSGTYTVSGVITTTLTQTLLSGAFTASFASVNNFPTDQRWYGKIIPKRTTTGDASGVAPQTSGESEEVILFEGTSGGTYSGGIVNIVQRGTMGTIQQHHDNETPIIQVTPDAGYGVNLVTHGKGQFVYPGNQTSGGISEAKIVPQLQTVRVLDGLGISFSGVLHYSGMVNIYDSTQMISGPWINNDLVWVTERNSGTALRSGQRYGGQFVGYSMSRSGGAVSAPVYVANLGGGSSVTPDILVQLTEKSYTGPCPTYYGFRVLDLGDCEYSDDAWPASEIVCLPIFHEQMIDLPVAPPPSPRKALPARIVSDSSAGSVAWTNTDAAGQSDNAWALCALQAGQTTQYLKATEFCFNLPDTTSSITRISVRVEAHASGNSVTDVEAKLVVGGSITGASATVGNTINTTDSVTTYEFTSSLPSVAQVNADDFGFVIRYSNGSGDARSVFVDVIEIRVYFSPSSAGVIAACVVRVRLGDDGTYYLIDHEPRWEIVKSDVTASPVVISGVSYQPGFLMRYSQTTKALVSVEDILLVDLSPLG